MRSVGFETEKEVRVHGKDGTSTTVERAVELVPREPLTGGGAQFDVIYLDEDDRRNAMVFPFKKIGYVEVLEGGEKTVIDREDFLD